MVPRRGRQDPTDPRTPTQIPLSVYFLCPVVRTQTPGPGPPRNRARPSSPPVPRASRPSYHLSPPTPPPTAPDCLVPPLLTGHPEGPPIRREKEREEGRNLSSYYGAGLTTGCSSAPWGCGCHSPTQGGVPTTPVTDPVSGTPSTPTTSDWKDLGSVGGRGHRVGTPTARRGPVFAHPVFSALLSTPGEWGEYRGMSVGIDLRVKGSARTGGLRCARPKTRSPYRHGRT